MRTIKQWLIECWNHNQALPAPQQIRLQPGFQENQVPFLIYRPAGKGEKSRTPEREWNRMFQHFFEDRVFLVQLSAEYDLLLIPFSRLEHEELVSPRETIFLWGQSLLTLMENEGREQNKITMAEETMPEQMGEILIQMRETHELASFFYPGLKLAAPWLFPLESTVMQLDRKSREFMYHHLVQLLGVDDEISDEEQRTLEAFMHHNLNISETSRALYMHRNTLLYRLDRWKETTDLDPRRFQDAAAIKLLFLLKKSLS